MYVQGILLCVFEYQTHPLYLGFSCFFPHTRSRSGLDLWNLISAPGATTMCMVAFTVLHLTSLKFQIFTRPRDAATALSALQIFVIVPNPSVVFVCCFFFFFFFFWVGDCVVFFFLCSNANIYP